MTDTHTVTHNVEYDSDEAGWFTEFWLQGELLEESGVVYNETTAQSWGEVRVKELQAEENARVRVAELARLRGVCRDWLRKAAKARVGTNQRWLARKAAVVFRDRMLEYE